MIISIDSLVEEGKRIKIEEFTLKDMREIAFMIETDSDDELYDFLLSKIKTPCHSIDKFNALLYARIHFLDDMVSMQGEDKSVSVAINAWYKSLKNNFKNIRERIEYDKFSAIINYPDNFVFTCEEDVIIDCVESITYQGKEINLLGESLENKMKILDRLPTGLIEKIVSFINNELQGNNIILMRKTNFLEEVNINLINGSAFTLMKSLFNYCSSDDLIELAFSLSRRIPDMEYLNNLSFREINLIIKLYSDETQKMSEK